MAVDASKEVRGLLEAHSPFRQEAAFVGEGEQGGEVLMDDVWQSCLKILNETPS